MPKLSSGRLRLPSKGVQAKYSPWISVHTLHCGKEMSTHLEGVKWHVKENIYLYLFYLILIINVSSEFSFLQIYPCFNIKVDW